MRQHVTRTRQDIRLQEPVPVKIKLEQEAQLINPGLFHAIPASLIRILPLSPVVLRSSPPERPRINRRHFQIMKMPHISRRESRAPRQRDAGNLSVANVNGPPRFLSLGS